MDNNIIKMVSINISNPLYHGNIETTKQLIKAIEKYVGRSITDWKEYVSIYDWSGFTFKTWEQLLESEKEQSDPMNETECIEELNHSIFKLPCGWYVQFV